MTTDTDAIYKTKDNGALWFQPEGPNSKPRYLGCHTLGDLSAPEGGTTLIQCIKNGQFTTLGATQAPPESITANIGFYVGKTLEWLEKAKCPGTLFAMLRCGGRPDVWGNYDRAFVIPVNAITTRNYTGLVSHTEDQVAMGNVDIEGAPPIIHAFKQIAVRQSIAETADLEDIAVCNAERCFGPCGDALDAGEVLIATGKGLAASPSNEGQVWLSSNGGSSWAVAAADPLASGEDMGPAVCFPISASITRRIVGRGETDAGNPAEVAITDDGGATFSLVNVGSTNGQYFANAHTIFALDPNNIWAVTTGGYIYKSEDMGESWTTQNAGIATAQDLRHVHFLNERIGYAVGASNAFVRTLDGGANWALVTGPAVGVVLTTVHAAPDGRVWVGDAGGNLWYSDNRGDTWTQRAFVGDGAGEVASVQFANKWIGYLLHNTAAPVGYVHVTINGGYSWERLDLVTNAGLNGLAVVNERLAYAVGAVSGGTAVVLKITGG
jgi:photosystem II stability/assembly factor-like uncharacterized protein